MEFFEAVATRRSIRKFTEAPVPEEVVRKALEAAVLAPNSSNLQTWDFYWVRSPGAKAELVKNCLNQSAARTAAELVVITADPQRWKRSNPELIAFAARVNAPSLVKLYYSKLIPATYRVGLLQCFVPFKWLATTFVGFVRPMGRGPHSTRDLQEVAIKSAALASENFVLALASQGVATCMMEGFDEWRVRKQLNLPRSTRIVMVVALGYSQPKGTWGERFRIPLEQVVHEI